MFKSRTRYRALLGTSAGLDDASLNMMGPPSAARNDMRVIPTKLGEGSAQPAPRRTTPLEASMIQVVGTTLGDSPEHHGHRVELTASAARETQRGAPA